MFSIRFHLGRGNHYKHWQIKDLTYKNDAPVYFDPAFTQLTMVNCKLVNNEKKAKQVYEAGVKDVCGWIRCENFFVSDLNKYNPVSIDGDVGLLYNPIVAPYWMRDDKEGSIDNTFYLELITMGNKAYIYKPNRSTTRHLQGYWFGS
jgi:hypothetical protein